MSLRGLVIGIAVVVLALAVFVVSLWLLAADLGPRAMSAGQVINLTIDTSARTGTAYEVDLAWDGGEGSLISQGLYDALYPLKRAGAGNGRAQHADGHGGSRRTQRNLVRER